MGVTLSALMRAVAPPNPEPGLLFHSDCGIEYSGYGYQAFLRSRGIVPSMNRSRDWQDNAHTERFFHALKAELERQHRFTSDTQLNGQLGAATSNVSTTSIASTAAWGHHSPVESERLAIAWRSDY